MIEGEVYFLRRGRAESVRNSRHGPEDEGDQLHTGRAQRDSGAGSRNEASYGRWCDQGKRRVSQGWRHENRRGGSKTEYFMIVKV